MAVDELGVRGEDVPSVSGWVAKELIDKCDFPVKRSGWFPGMNFKTPSGDDVGLVLGREFA